MNGWMDGSLNRVIIIKMGKAIERKDGPTRDKENKFISLPKSYYIS